MYLLSQNQLVMKRTLHLTVVMLLAIIASVNRAYGQEAERVVLYETDFSDGLDGWTGKNWWTYDSEKKCLHGTISTKSQGSIVLYRTINTNGIYYKDIEVEYDMSTVYSNGGIAGFYGSINGNYDEWKFRAPDNLYRYGIPRCDFQICFTLHIKSETGYTPQKITAVGDLRRVKITGIPFVERDFQPEYEIFDMSQFPNLPEMSTVKVNFTDATVLTRQGGTVILLDKEKGGMVINDSVGLQNIVQNEEGMMGQPYVISGSVKGFLLTRNGSPELHCATYDTEISENQQPRCYGREIEFDDYSNHIGEFVAIPSLADIDLWDRTAWDENIDYISSTEESKDDENYRISGVVFPYKNGGNLRLIKLNVAGAYYGLKENAENDYQKSNGLNGQVPRILNKGKWYTLCLPFDIKTSSYKGEYAKFDGASNGTLSFKTANISTIPAGTPIMYKPESDMTSPFNGTVKIDSGDPVYDSQGEYSFVGTFNPVQPKDGSYYLSEGNTIRPLAPGGIIKAFRAYFEPATPNAALARSISIDGMTTAINEIEWGDGNPFISPTDNRIYNLEGQMVGNALEQLPKGIYIVNGKKVLK